MLLTSLYGAVVDVRVRDAKANWLHSMFLSDSFVWHINEMNFRF